MTRMGHVVLLFVFALPLLTLAQTSTQLARKSYLMPDDSVSVDISLQPGDVLKWSLWLAATETGSTTALTLRSDVEGEIWHKMFSGEKVDTQDEVKISKAAIYRLTAKSAGTHGRPCELSAWSKLGTGNRAPFPFPNVQRLAEHFTAGDRFTTEFEFLLPDTTKFQNLLALELPKDLVSLWAITPLGDSLVATPSVSRWFGDAGVISIAERSRKKETGRISLKLELDIPEGGDMTVFVAPGSAAPLWLPKTTRMTTTHKHDPWSVVIVPPQAVWLDSLRARQPESPRSQYSIQGMRVSGTDPQTIAELTPVYVERDSLNARRRARLESVTGYDTLFLIGDKAFLPPMLDAALYISLVGQTHKTELSRQTVVSWFIEGEGKVTPSCRLFEWHYDEAHIASSGAPDEWFWDKSVIPLQPELEIRKAEHSEKPEMLTLLAPAQFRPSTFEQNGREYLDESRRVLGLYLENTSHDTVYLVYHTEHSISRPLAKTFFRLPKFARYALLGLGAFAIVGVFALIELRRRERRRQKMAEELNTELEKARQVQRKFLPSDSTEIKGLEIVGIHQSMLSVGGDYYDFFPLEDGRALICVADVAGHGLPAALLMSNLQATLRALAQQSSRGVAEMVSLLNHEMVQRTSPERFVTLLLAEISADRTQITACNAGHNPGYIVRRGGNIIELDAGGIMLGVMDMFPFIQMEYGLENGDLIAFYTDGIPEAEIGFEDMFGYERLKYFLDQHKDERPADIAQSLIKRVTPDDRDAIADDMAIVLARVKR